MAVIVQIYIFRLTPAAIASKNRPGASKVGAMPCAKKLISPIVSTWFGWSSPPVKNISLGRDAKSPANSAHPVPQEGRIAIVTDVGAGCGGRGGALDEWRRRGRRSRVVLTPRRWRQVCGRRWKALAVLSRRACDGGKKARLTEESTKETVKTIRVRECRVIPVRPWWTYSCGFVFSHARLRVLTGTRHSPRPLFSGAGIFGIARVRFASRDARAHGCLKFWIGSTTDSLYARARRIECAEA